jgi:hypothetical protein
MRSLGARGKLGNASGTRTPSKDTTMAPLMKSWAKAMGLWGFELYFEATKDRSIKSRPPTKIQGNHAGIIE